MENASRAVFYLNMSGIRADEAISKIFFEPTHHENARLVNQAGFFRITPSGRDNLVTAIVNELTDNAVIDPSDPMDVARFIGKIHIPNEHRVECLNTLRKMNIHHANLSPDAGGASKYCNDWLSRPIDWNLHMVPGKHEPIISFETYQAVQRRMKGAPTRRSAGT